MYGVLISEELLMRYTTAESSNLTLLFMKYVTDKYKGHKYMDI